MNPVILISMITVPPAIWNSLILCMDMVSNLSFASHRLRARTTVSVTCVATLSKGFFYRCKLCEFDVLPLCNQLPEYVRHMMHKDHPLRLQRSVPGRCRVRKDTCTSWHYRCEICCFDLHLECVLAPCAEVTTTTSTPRSLKTPASVLHHHQLHLFLMPVMLLAMGLFHYLLILRIRLLLHCLILVLMLMAMESPLALANITLIVSIVIVVKFREMVKKMYAIAGNLALGVLNNMVFGTLFS